MNEWLDPQTYIDIIQKTFYTAIKFPVETIRNIPPSIKITIIILTTILMLFILIICYKTRNKWMNRTY